MFIHHHHSYTYQRGKFWVFEVLDWEYTLLNMSKLYFNCLKNTFPLHRIFACTDTEIDISHFGTALNSLIILLSSSNDQTSALKQDLAARHFNNSGKCSQILLYFKIEA